jgi:nucleoside-diphosphate-sugar epimerase
MRIFVTGGGGYIGTSLLPMLVQSGHDVTVLDRFFFGKECLQIPDGPGSATLLRDDIRWFDGKLLQGMDVVIDMAALSNDPAGELDPWKTLDINYLGRARVARLAREAGVPRYILTSSCSVYGFQEPILTEDSPPNPLTVYARANVLAEGDILPLATDSFSTVAVRFATLYGLSGRMRFDLAVNGMVLGGFRNGKIPVMKDGTQWRPFMHVRDAARSLIHLTTQPLDRIRGRVFNVGSDEQNYRIRDLAERVAGAMTAHPQLEWYGDADTRSYRVSFARVKNELGFQPRETPESAAQEIEAALGSGQLVAEPRTKTVDWYRHLLSDTAAGMDVRLHGTIF